MAVLAINGGAPVRTRPLGVSWPVWDERDVEAVAAVVRSGKWGCIAGTRVKAFEQHFAQFCGAKHALCLTNGTAAIEVALRAVGVGPGDEVIVPPYTFIATASAVVMIGAIPRFVDIEPETLNMDPKKLDAAINDRTKVIMPVHMGGRPADMDRIMAVAQRHGLRVVEDACQAHGAMWRNRHVGTIGDAGGFSFQASKNITAGEAGAVIANNDDVYLRCYSIVNVGRVPEGEWYQHEHLGSNYRMTEFQGALLETQMARWEKQAARRTQNAAYLDSLLSDIDGVAPLVEHPGITRNALHIYIFRYFQERFGGIPKARFLQALSAEGIGASSGYTPLHTSGMFQRFARQLREKQFFGGEPIDYDALDLPATQNACDNEACWLLQAVLLGEKKDMDDIAAAVRKVREHCEEL